MLCRRAVAASVRARFLFVLLPLVVAGLLALAGCDDNATPPGATSVLLAADDNGDLYTIDPASGASTLVKDVWTLDTTDTQVNVGRVGGMAFDPTTQRLIVGVDGQAASCPGCIYAVNLATGQAVLINDQDLAQVDGLARRPGDGAVIALEAWDGVLIHDIDPLTGAVSTLPSANYDLCCEGLGFTFASDGTPYAAGGNPGSGIELNTLDSTDLSVSTVVATATDQGFPTALSSNEIINSMAMAPDGMLYGILEDAGATYLVVIDPGAGSPTVTYRATLPVHLDGLTTLSMAALNVSAPASQTGAIGGHPFTVVAGAISQSSPNQPLTVGPGGATLLFDQPTTQLLTPDDVNIAIVGSVLDGGFVAPAAMGQANGDFSNSLGAKTTRSGTNFTWELYWGVDGTPDETGAFAAPTSPDGVLYFTVDIHNDAASLPGTFTLWGLENSTPTQCTGAVYSIAAPNWGPATGNRVQVQLKSTRIESVIISEALEPNGC
jgi:hypothetical protein